MRAVSIVLSLAILGMAPPAGVPLRVQWAAHADCPDLNGYWQEVSARSHVLRRAQPGELAHEGKVTIQRVGEQSVATLVLDGGEPRRVTGATCGEAVRALALVTVVALDAALTVPSPSASASSSAPPAPSAAPPLPTPSAAPLPTPHVAPADLSSFRPQSEWRPGLGVAVGGLAAGAVSTVATAVFFDIERWRRASLRLSLDRAASPFVDSVAGTGATFTWTTARLDVCSVPWSGGDRFALFLCAGVEAGALRGTPTGAVASRPRTRGWVAGWALARFQWLIGRGFALEIEGAGGVPYTRDEFTFDPGVVVYRPAAWAGRARLGILVAFQ